MKLIANLNLFEELPVRPGQEVEFEYVEDLGYESEEIKYLAADPVIDGLIRFRHPDAPWGQGAENVAKDLNEKWNQLVEEDDFSGNIPAEDMVGTMFLVFCWKDFEHLSAGEIYEATIEEFHGFATDGFVICHNNQKVIVDMITDVINHFVLV